jgi:hypothetical protein
MKNKYKLETWSEIKEYFNHLEFDIFRFSHKLVVGVLWLGVIMSLLEGDHANAVAFAVINIAWKMK